ncbi:Tudor domain-containing protein [Aphelenchoides fujianensis]|nr:Tudor domain-containing protein [Aphelenchoides fujianensis]
MRLRVKFGAERRVLENAADWTVDDLRVFAADAFGLGANTPLDFFLGEECISRDPAAKLDDLGVVSGDLLVMKSAAAASTASAALLLVGPGRNRHPVAGEKSQDYSLHEEAINTAVVYFAKSGEKWRLRVETNANFDQKGAVLSVHVAALLVHSPLQRPLASARVKEAIFGPDNHFLRTFFFGSPELSVRLFDLLGLEGVLPLRRTCRLVHAKSNGDFVDTHFWKRELRKGFGEQAVNAVNASDPGAFRRALMRNLRRQERAAFVHSIRQEAQLNAHRMQAPAANPLEDPRFQRAYREPRVSHDPFGVIDDNFSRGEIFRVRDPNAPDHARPDIRPLGPGHEPPPSRRGGRGSGGGHPDLNPLRWIRRIQPLHLNISLPVPMAAVEQPHRATRAMRDRSVCVRKPRMQERQDLGLTSRYLTERTSIHRIFLNCETQVEVVNAVSPSCLWVKLPHHTSADYDVRLDEQRVLRPAVGGGERPVLFRYFLAPRLDPQRAADGEDNVVYSRVRLLDTKLKEGRFFCYVHFIDYGEGAWVLADCLAEMPKDLWCHPWQTVPVALLGVFPETADGVEDEATWSERQCALLARTLRRFKRFIARPVVTEKDDLLYEHYARVSLEALVEEAGEPLEEDPNRAEADERPADQEADILPVDEEKEREEKEKKKREQLATVRSKEMSVETEFAFLCSIEGEPIRFDRDVDECTQQPLFGRRNEIPRCPQHIEEPWRRQFPHFEGQKEDEETEVLEQEQDDAERLLDELRGEDAKEEAAAREREQLLKWDPAIEKCTTFTHQCRRH